MSKNWQSILKKIDPVTRALLQTFSEVAVDCPWLLIGATARDFYAYQYELPIVRATRDIDLAIQVRDWEQFEGIKERLLTSDEFKEGDRVMRVLYRELLPIDLVPFGAVADKNYNIHWPPKGEPEMSVVGFDDVLKNADSIILDDKEKLSFRIATPAGLCILKIIAWADNPLIRIRDVQDLAFVIEHYLDMDNWERLSAADSDITDMEDFGTILASARLLGRDIAKITSNATKARLVEILSEEITHGELSKLVATLDDTLSSEALPVAKSLLEGLGDV